jgi:hypothetical protein
MYQGAIRGQVVQMEATGCSSDGFCCGRESSETTLPLLLLLRIWPRVHTGGAPRGGINVREIALSPRKKSFDFLGCNSGQYSVPAALNKDWQSIQRLYLTGQYTFVQLAELFSVPPGAIRTRACRQKWKSLQAEVAERRETRVINPQTGELTETAEAAVEAAVNVIGKQTFRQRVAKQAEKVLNVLSGEKPETLYDCAGFIGVLDKVERVGARAYGLEEQAEGASRCIINLAVLQDAPGFSTPPSRDTPQRPEKSSLLCGIQGGNQASFFRGRLRSLRSRRAGMGRRDTRAGPHAVPLLGVTEW